MPHYTCHLRVQLPKGYVETRKDIEAPHRQEALMIALKESVELLDTHPSGPMIIEVQEQGEDSSRTAAFPAIRR